MSKSKKVSIKCWSVEDRPREKLLLKGTKSLSNAELIAILIGTGSNDRSAVEISRLILNSVDNNLYELGKLNVSDLQKFRGIGAAKAISIISAMELGRRRNLSRADENVKITGSKDVFWHISPLIGDLKHEEFWLLLLNRANRIIKKIRLTKGGVSGTVIDIKIIMKNAVDNLASSIILCHNHPSGNINPSRADEEITEKIKNAAIFMEIKVLDHVIIGNNSYFSFLDEGIL